MKKLKRFYIMKLEGFDFKTIVDTCNRALPHLRDKNFVLDPSFQSVLVQLCMVDDYDLDNSLTHFVSFGLDVKEEEMGHILLNWYYLKYISRYQYDLSKARKTCVKCIYSSKPPRTKFII